MKTRVGDVVPHSREGLASLHIRAGGPLDILVAFPGNPYPTRARSRRGWTPFHSPSPARGNGSADG
jgi:hypothetical protein